MNKTSKTSKRYRSRESYISKDPVKRQHSLDNLIQYREGRAERKKVLRGIGYYVVCPYCKKLVVTPGRLKVIISLLHFSRCKDCQYFERFPEPKDLMWDHRTVEIVAQCKDKLYGGRHRTFFTEEQLARNNESIVNELGCTYSEEKREELVCCGFEARKD